MSAGFHRFATAPTHAGKYAHATFVQSTPCGSFPGYGICDLHPGHCAARVCPILCVGVKSTRGFLQGAPSAQASRWYPHAPVSVMGLRMGSKRCIRDFAACSSWTGLPAACCAAISDAAISAREFPSLTIHAWTTDKCGSPSGWSHDRTPECKKPFSATEKVEHGGAKWPQQNREEADVQDVEVRVRGSIDMRCRIYTDVSKCHRQHRQAREEGASRLHYLENTHER